MAVGLRNTNDCGFVLGVMAEMLDGNEMAPVPLRGSAKRLQYAVHVAGRGAVVGELGHVRRNRAGVGHHHVYEAGRDR